MIVQFYKENLTLFTTLGILLGALLGQTMPQDVASFDFVGDLFINGFICLVHPLIFSAISLAILRSDRDQPLLRLGIFVFVFYLLSSGIASMLVFFLSERYFHPTELSFGQAIAQQEVQMISLTSILSNLLPKNILSAFFNGNIVQIVILSIAFAIAARTLKQREIFIDMLSGLYEVCIYWVHGLLKVAPFALVVLTAKITAQLDYDSIWHVVDFFYVIAIAVSIQAFLVLPGLGLIFGRFNPLHFFWRMKDALLLSFTTASSAAAVPLCIDLLKKENGVNHKKVEFIMPLGSAINMDGSALYQSMVVIFLAKASGMNLDIGQQFAVFGFVMLSAAGTAGIPGGGLVLVASALKALGIPMELLGFYILVDRFWDYPVTVVNTWGDVIAARILAQDG